MMARHRIAWLPGDGIGKDVMDAARIVLDRLALDAQYLPGDVGWEFWKAEGDALPARTIQLLRSTDCCLFGAVTSKALQEAGRELAPGLQGKGLTYQSPIVRIRQLFDLHINLRPCRAYRGNPLNFRDDIDLMVFRENTEGLYSGVEFHPLPEEVRQVLLAHHSKMARFAELPGEELALSCRICTRQGCRRILRAAFDYARAHGRDSVTVVEKPNILRATSGMMIREAREMAGEYPEVELREANIDAMCMWLLKSPQDYGVLVTSNMFGDILSDLCAQLVGGLGFAPSANLGEHYALFEPTHGSAPKYAGQYRANPIAMLLTVKLMLDWLVEGEKAKALEEALAGTIAEGKVRTYDMGGEAGTLDMARAIAERLG